MHADFHRRLKELRREDNRLLEETAPQSIGGQGTPHRVPLPPPPPLLSDDGSREHYFVALTSWFDSKNSHRGCPEIFCW